MAEGRVVAILLLLGHFHIGLTLPFPNTRELQDASCPGLCNCSSWLLSCIGTGKQHQLDNVPYIRDTSHMSNTVDLPDQVRCCLCSDFQTTEILFETVKTECSKPCANDTSCEHLMKLFEGKEYLPEVGSWNSSLLSPNVKEEGEGNKTETFPLPITRPEQKQKPYMEHGEGKGKHAPISAEIYTEEPKKPLGLSSVQYGHKFLLSVAIIVEVMIIAAVVSLIEIYSRRLRRKARFAPCKKHSRSPLKKLTEQITRKKSKDAPQPVTSDTLISRGHTIGCTILASGIVSASQSVTILIE
ncbi:uncharacterized protein [Narcine bancroftii]|uniref:uncharacterized protein isoform X2 n=1 Tax=Narcine bancroftii TaxID=1343680 RepID=UPI0038314265